MIAKICIVIFLCLEPILLHTVEEQGTPFAPGPSAVIERSEDAQKALKYNLAVCSVFKNEAPFLKEWIEYYRLLGVDHFYLYDNGSADESHQVLRPYIRKGLVSLTLWPNLVDEKTENPDELWALSSQVSAYHHATYVKAVRETKWLIFLNVNEFLVSTEANALGNLLKKYENYPGITMETDFFDAGTLGKVPQRKLVVESIELTAPERNPPKEVTKTIFKPRLCKGLFWPPCSCNFYDNAQAATVNKSELRVNRYLNRAQDFRLWKRKTVLDIDNRLLSETELAALLDEGYAIEDKRSSDPAPRPTAFKEVRALRARKGIISAFKTASKPRGFAIVSGSVLDHTNPLTIVQPRELSRSLKLGTYFFTSPNCPTRLNTVKPLLLKRRSYKAHSRCRFRKSSIASQMPRFRGSYRHGNSE